MKHLAFLIIAILLLSSEVFADWQYFTADKSYQYWFETDIASVYPHVYTDIQLKPIGRSGFTGLVTPAARAAATQTATVSALVDCAVTDAVGFSEFKAHLRTGKTLLITKSAPDALNIELLSRKIRAVLCRQNGPPPPERWVAVGRTGTQFDAYYPYVDIESARDVAGEVTFWLRKQPMFPVIYGANEDLFDSFAQAEDFEYLLLRVTADCFERSLRGHYMSTRSHDGLVLRESDDYVVGKRVQIEPGSFNEDLLKFVCSQMAKP